MRSILAAALALSVVSTSHTQDTPSRAVERSIAELEQSRFFVVPPRTKADESKGHRLLVVLPGGTGSADFLPFVENGIGSQVSDDCVVAMLTATQWVKEQATIWPTAASPVTGMGYTTEAFVEAVVTTLRSEFAVKADAVAVLAWSSSGPAIYPMLVDPKGPFTKGYVAMSVWPASLKKSKLTGARGRRIVLDQSPDDSRTPFHHVRRAHGLLTKARAIVRVNVYEGGHGWLDAPLPRVRSSLEWLFDDSPAPTPAWPPPPKVGKNLLVNGGFEEPAAEHGVRGWAINDNSKRIRIAIATDTHAEGKQSLHLQKTGGMPLDVVVQDVDLPAGRKLEVSVRVKSDRATNARIKVWRYDENDEAIGTDVDLAQIPATTDWKSFEKSWSTDGAVRATVQILMMTEGQIWIDAASLVVKK